jgi:hypothetical protein
MNIYKEQAGVISDEETWVCMHDVYLYTADTLEQLIHILNTEWEHEKHYTGGY